MPRRKSKARKVPKPRENEIEMLRKQLIKECNRGKQQEK